MKSKKSPTCMLEFNYLEIASMISALKAYDNELQKLVDPSAPGGKLNGEIQTTESALEKLSREMKRFAPGVPL